MNIPWKDKAEAEALILWPPDAELTHWKRLRAEEKGATEEMVVCHHRLSGDEFE